MTPFTKESARVAGKRSAARRAEAVKAGKLPSSRLTAAQWDTLYIVPSFGDDWGVIYRKTYKELEEQYASSADTAQYRILVRETAALATLAARMQTAKKPPYALLGQVRDQLLRFTAQLQRYTESEKAELTVRDELQSAIIEQVVALAEATVTDLRQRENFLISLMRQLVSEDAARSVERVRLPDGTSDVVDAEVVESVNGSVE